MDTDESDLPPEEGEAEAPDVLEHFFDCPHCGASISMLLDTSVIAQSFIEDCEVCCNPIDVSYRFDDDVLVVFRAEAGT